MKTLRDWLRKAKNFYQRGVRGYSDQDLWSFDAFLLDIMVRGLRDFKKNGLVGHPVDIDMDKWERTIDNIADGLESGIKLMDGDYKYKNKAQRLQKEFENGMVLLKKHYFNLWD
jgi:hypothetical protein